MKLSSLLLNSESGAGFFLSVVVCGGGGGDVVGGTMRKQNTGKLVAYCSKIYGRGQQAGQPGNQQHSSGSHS